MVAFSLASRKAWQVGAAQNHVVQGASELDYWTLAIAILGAVTGVVALATEVWGLVLAGPRVKVSVANALPVPADDPEWVLSVDASNVGRLPVTLLDFGVAFDNNGKRARISIGMMHPDDSYGPRGPHRLPDGEAVTWLVKPEPIAITVAERGERYVRGYVRLATGKIIYSRSRIDVIQLNSFD
jgi:hypothetical protein